MIHRHPGSTSWVRCCRSSGLVGLVYSIIEAPRHGWTSPESVFGFAASLTVLAIFVAYELKHDEPMLDVRFFKNPRFTAASISVTLVSFALFGFIFMATQYLQFVHGLQPALGRRPHDPVRAAR